MWENEYAMEITPEKYLLATEDEIDLPELSAEDLAEAQLAAADMTREFSHASQLQAEVMADSTQIMLTPEDIRLYSALCELLPESMGGRIRTGDTSRFASYLSDQKLLAVVLKQSGDSVRLLKFVSFYPNIFPQLHKG